MGCMGCSWQAACVQEIQRFCTMAQKKSTLVIIGGVLDFHEPCFKARKPRAPPLPQTLITLFCNCLPHCLQPWQADHVLVPGSGFQRLSILYFPHWG